MRKIIFIIFLTLILILFIGNTVLAIEECTSRLGTHYEIKELFPYCDGESIRCENIFDQPICETQEGCTWIGDVEGLCGGIPKPCKEIKNEDLCLSQQGCEWIVPSGFNETSQVWWETNHVWEISWYSKSSNYFSGIIKGDIYNITFYNTTIIEEGNFIQCSESQTCLNLNYKNNTLTFEASSPTMEEDQSEKFRFISPSNNDINFDLMQGPHLRLLTKNPDKIYLINEGVTPPTIPFTLGRNYSQYYSDLYYNESKVMIIVIDGVYAGHVNKTYMPHITGDLKAKGKWYNNIWTHGRSYTTDGHNTIITGMHLWSTNGPMISTTQPTLFNYLAEKYNPYYLRAEISNSWAGGMYKTTHPAYKNVQATNRPFVECSGADAHVVGFNPRPDEFMAERVIEQINKNQSIFWFINLDDVDSVFHRKDKNLNEKLNEVKEADQAVYNIIKAAESNPFYANKTTYFITTDHGRFQKGLVFFGKELGIGDYSDWNHYYEDPHEEIKSWMPFFYQGPYSIENKVFLLVIGPDQAFRPGSESNIKHGLEDIAPTVAEIFEVSLLDYIDGKSLFKEQKPLSPLCFKNCLQKSTTFKGLQMCIVRCLSGAQS